MSQIKSKNGHCFELLHLIYNIDCHDENFKIDDHVFYNELPKYSRDAQCIYAYLICEDLKIHKSYVSDLIRLLVRDGVITDKKSGFKAIRDLINGGLVKYDQLVI